MSETKWRKGPYVAVRAESRLRGFSPIFNDGLWHIHEQGKLHLVPVAVVDSADDHDEETRARAEFTAHLLAASEDLYAAASLVDQLFSRMNISTADGDFMGDDEHEAWSAIQKALAKARGEA